MDAALDFASASALESAVAEHLAAQPDLRRVCLFAQPINRIDATGVETFVQMRRMLADRGVALHLVGMKQPVESVLRKAGALEEGPLLKTHRTDAQALHALQGPAQ